MYLLLIASIVYGVATLEQSKPTLTDSRMHSGALNCKEAGWVACCTEGKCIATAGQCFCDNACHTFGDCCADIEVTCPYTGNEQSCGDREIKIFQGKIKLCINGTYKNICDVNISDLQKTATMPLEQAETVKRRASDQGSGSGAGNIVEVGFADVRYTARESELKVLVCVEVKSGMLTPAESALVTVSTLSSTATGDMDYDTVIEDVVFDGNTFRDVMCIEVPIADDVYYEPMEYFSVILTSSCPTVVLDEDSSSAMVSIISTGMLAGNTCAEVGLDTQCCVDSDEDQCHSLSSSCYCDLSCFQRGDCCEDIFMYAVELKVSTVYVSEASDEATAVQVCAVVTGRYDNAVEDVIVALNFIDSQLAVEGEDYQPNSTWLVFPIQQQLPLHPGGQIMQCVNIDIVDDTRVEGEHVFTVEIASVSPPPVVVQCNPTSITVHIVDDDVTVVRLTLLPETVPEEELLRVCVVMSGADYIDIPLTLNFTVSRDQGIILTSQIVFPVGEVGSDRVECSEVSVDNNILDWSWQLSVMLDSSLYDQPIILSSNDTTLFVNVIDNEANSVSVHFETDSVAVTEGHRTVVCVVLDGVPTGGMSEDLPLTLLLANNTAELGTDFLLGGSDQNDSITLLFRQGSSRASVETTRCVLIDTVEVTQCREKPLELNLNITSSTLPVRLQQPLTATVSIQESNGTCICPRAECSPQTEDSNRESFYLTLLLAMSAVAAVLLGILFAVIILFCCYCKKHRHYYREATGPGSNAGMTIQNVMAGDHMYMDYNRTKTTSSVGSITNSNITAHDNSDVRAPLPARKKAVRFMVPDHESDSEPEMTTTSATADYEEPIPHVASNTSTKPLVTQL